MVNLGRIDDLGAEQINQIEVRFIIKVVLHSHCLTHSIFNIYASFCRVLKFPLDALENIFGISNACNLDFKL